YNRYRYYEPESGRYISADPLKLGAGLNLYAYAPNPLGWIDPLGLAKTCKSNSKKISFTDWIKQKAKGGNNTHVYIGYRDGKPVYVGISKDVDTRAGQHGDRFDRLVPLTDTPLNRGHARSIEQAIIHNNPHLEN
ncbi:RHS repeat-associated core domain-containing protein, partial [Salmonella enterica]